MANQENKQNKQSDSAKSGQNNKSEFGTTPSSSANAAGTSRGDTNSTNTGSGAIGAPTGGSSTGTPGGSGFTGTTGGSGSTGGSQTGMSSGTSSSGSGTGAATATARTLIDQAKETAGQAYEAVTDKAATKLDEQKTTLSSGLTTVADSIRQASQNLSSSQTDSGLAEAAAKYTDTAAGKLEEVATYFEGRNVREMARDLESFARRNPAVFFGAAFGLGLLAARFLKSSPTGFDDTGAGRSLSASATADRQLNPTSSKESGGNTPNAPSTRL